MGIFYFVVLEQSIVKDSTEATSSRRFGLLKDLSL